MAAKKQETATTSNEATEPEPVNEAEELYAKVDGHDHVELEDEDGKVYRFGYDRAIVRKMERDGFSFEKLSGTNDSSLTATEDFYDSFIFPAFKKFQPKATKEEFYKVIEEIPDKTYFSQVMVALYMQPVRSLTMENPTSTAKMRLV